MAGAPDQRPAPSLLCQWGKHTPERLPIWNEGYYFSRCRRCGSDIVRPLDGGWQVPSGYRVVWRTDRPADEPTPLLRPEAVAPLATPPIEEVAEDRVIDEDVAAREILKEEHPAPEPEALAEDEPVEDRIEPVAEEPMEDSVEPIAAEPVEAIEPPTVVEGPALPTETVRRSLIPDFMDDGAGRAQTASPQPAGASSPARARAEEGVTAASLSSMFRRIADARNREEAPETSRPVRSRGFAAAAALAFGAGAFSVWALGLTGGDKPASPPADYRIPPNLSARAPQTPAVPERSLAVAKEAPASPVARTPRPEAGSASAGDQERSGADRVVTASVLNCRKAPSTQASVKLKMVKGVPLTASRESGEWSYVVRRGHRCWVQTRMIAPR